MGEFHVIDKLFRDMPLMAAFVFLAMVVLMLPFFNPPKQDEEAKNPGNMSAQIAWEPGYTSDVDLHVMGPESDRDVYYGRKSGPVWNLLRDDLGRSNDSLPANFENAYTRGLPAGRYAVNVRCYRCDSSELPIKVQVEVSYRQREGSDMRVVHRGVVTIVHDRQELTAVQFELSKDGFVVPGSKSNLYVPMWAGEPGGGNG